MHYISHNIIFKNKWNFVPLGGINRQNISFGRAAKLLFLLCEFHLSLPQARFVVRIYISYQMHKSSVKAKKNGKTEIRSDLRNPVVFSQYTEHTVNRKTSWVWGEAVIIIGFGQLIVSLNKPVVSKKYYSGGDVLFKLTETLSVLSFYSTFLRLREDFKSKTLHSVASVSMHLLWKAKKILGARKREKQ